jgi:protein farnesyltransferase/geranylgeranyltransferase type-1 subunit alpha
MRIRGVERVQRARDRIADAGLEPVLQLNPADYTAWEIARELGEDDLAKADQWCRRFPKNYQVWHHRRVLLIRRLTECEALEASALSALGAEELDRLDALLTDPENAKNYHLYSHRQWLIRNPQLLNEDLLWREWNSTTVRELERDPLNNSAWQHRWAVLTELRRRGCFHLERDAFAEDLVERVRCQPAADYVSACRACLAEKCASASFPERCG